VLLALEPGPVNFEQQMFRYPEKGKLLLCAKNFFLSSDATVFTETILISAQRNSEMWKNCRGRSGPLKQKQGGRSGLNQSKKLNAAR